MAGSVSQTFTYPQSLFDRADPDAITHRSEGELFADGPNWGGHTMTDEAETLWELAIADSVTFGAGAVDELADVARSHDASRILVVTDRGVRDVGILERTIDPLSGVTVFDDVDPDPALPVFRRALEVAADLDPDLIVGLGGGSPMDVAKATSIGYAHGGNLLDYVAEPTGEGKPVPGPSVPTVCVPTTAGTGAETSPVAVISLPDEELKVGISSEYQRPDYALVDPELTLTLPPGPTAASGMDALAHAIEAYVTRPYHAKPAPDRREDRPDYGGRTVVTDMFAEAAIERIGTNLREVVHTGRNLVARREMALGSLLAGMAFTNAGVGATHALAMAAGALHHTGHGETIAHTLPAVMRFNARGAPERHAAIAAALGADDTGDGGESAALAAARAVEHLARDVGFEGGLRSLGIGSQDIEPIATRAASLDRLTVGNPRRVDQAALETILEEAL